MRMESLEEKKRIAGELFANGSTASAETTPREISLIVHQFAKTLGGTPEFVPVVCDPYGVYGFCSDGVAEKVKCAGGAIQVGWIIWEWPKVLLTSEFHAVWASPEGELIDITPKPQGETRIVFVKDYSYPANLDFDRHRPRNRRFCIPQEPDYGGLAATEIAEMSPTQIEYESKRAAKKGLTLLEWRAAKQPRATYPLLVQEFIGACDSYEQKRDSLRAGQSYYRPDSEYFELKSLRVRLQNQVVAVAARQS
jgi:hypothetical protein